MELTTTLADQQVFEIAQCPVPNAGAGGADSQDVVSPRKWGNFNSGDDSSRFSTSRRAFAGQIAIDIGGRGPRCVCSEQQWDCQTI